MFHQYQCKDGEPDIHVSDSIPLASRMFVLRVCASIHRKNGGRLSHGQIYQSRIPSALGEIVFSTDRSSGETFIFIEGPGNCPALHARTVQ